MGLYLYMFAKAAKKYTGAFLVLILVVVVFNKSLCFGYDSSELVHLKFNQTEKDQSIESAEGSVSEKKSSPFTAETDEGFFDESLNALFDLSEEGSGSMPNDGKNGDQPGSTSRRSLKPSFTGDFRNESAYRTNKLHHLSKSKNILNVNVSGVLSDNFSYVLGSRFSYDAVFDLNNDYNDKVENDQRTMADLRDAYVDFGFGNFDFRLGNQQVVWGQAVGLFFADIVNPKDLREFILPDLDQARIPIFAANMEYYSDNLYLQMIYIPFPEFNEFGQPGSEFDFSKNIYMGNSDMVFNAPLEPANSFDNSEVGFRVATLTRGWDLSLFYLYDMYNFPINYRSISLNPPEAQNPVTITYSPRYERMHRIGSTFSKDVMDAIFKGEFIYSSKMFLETFDVASPDGIEKSDTFEWLLGVDYTFSNRLESNFQLMQSIILDHQADMAQREIATSFSIWLKTGFFSDKIEPELFFVSSLNYRDGLLRPKVAWNAGDRLKFILGGDVFYGKSSDTFGMFDENDRVYLEILYSF